MEWTDGSQYAQRQLHSARAMQNVDPLCPVQAGLGVGSNWQDIQTRDRRILKSALVSENKNKRKKDFNQNSIIP